uniref:Carbohydrate degrading protein n=1 Tax=uncultured microorganism TaxID=358574 RepID=K0J3D0_9ZZZZ|nr:carbohydrate degrading protein [uncultured microorganism]
MKLRRVIIASLLLFAFQVNISISADIPSSRRSRNVISRVKPVIKKELEKHGLEIGSPIYIRIFKKSAELELWVENGEVYQLFKKYKICDFSGKLGPKIKVGDLQSPEGFYFVKPRQLNPSSQFHLSFNLGYPNAYDRAHGRTGSALMVHGNCVSIGCYAMTDNKIEEIYTLVDASFRNGQSFFRAHVFPFRMTEENMIKHKSSKWYSFWDNLKEGYDIFERDKRPPNVTVNNKRYVFEKT